MGQWLGLGLGEIKEMRFVCQEDVNWSNLHVTLAYLWSFKVVSLINIWNSAGTRVHLYQRNKTCHPVFVSLFVSCILCDMSSLTYAMFGGQRPGDRSQVQLNFMYNSFIYSAITHDVNMA